MATELLITIHDQDLLLECEASGQFAGLPHVYGFVGPRSVDRVPSDVRMIVARDHAPNFEHLPSTYDFSLWWAACHHGLIESDHVVCVQYDMLVNDPDILKKVDEQLDDPEVGMVAFTPGHRSAHNWMLLLDGFADTYRTAVETIGVNVDGWDVFEEWPSTQGTAWRTADLTHFMAWITPLFDRWSTDVWAGHLMERTVKAWCETFNRPEVYLPGMIHHLHGDSHGTCALMGGNVQRYAEKVATFGKLV